MVFSFLRAQASKPRTTLRDDKKKQQQQQQEVVAIAGDSLFGLTISSSSSLVRSLCKQEESAAGTSQHPSSETKEQEDHDDDHHHRDLPSSPFHHEEDLLITTSSSLDSLRLEKDTNSMEKNASSSVPAPEASTTPCITTQRIDDDTILCQNFLDNQEASTLLDEILQQVSWTEMRYRGKPMARLVCVQGETVSINHHHHHHHETSSTSSSSKKKKHKNTTTTSIYHPLYRNSADPQPPLESWSPAVRKLRDAVAASIMSSNNGKDDQKQEDPHCFFNHAVLQLYHSDDRRLVSEQADKTLDVAAGTDMPTVVHVSLGAPRTLTLRPKRQDATGQRRPSPRPTTHVHMPHASYVGLGSTTNQKMTHEVRLCDSVAVPASAASTNTSPNTSSSSNNAAAAAAYSGLRISIAFRSVATFVSPTTGQVFGRGARRIHKHHGTASVASSQLIPKHVASSSIPTSIISSSTTNSLMPTTPGTPQFTTPKHHRHHHFHRSHREEEEHDSDAATTDATIMTTPSVSSAGSKSHKSWASPLTASSKRTVDDACLSRQAKKLLHAFSKENRCENFDRQKSYGKGFDVVNIHKVMFGGGAGDANHTPPSANSAFSTKSSGKKTRTTPKAAATTLQKTPPTTTSSENRVRFEQRLQQNHKSSSSSSSAKRTPPSTKSDFVAGLSPTSVIKNLSLPPLAATPTTSNKGGGVALLAIDLQNDFLADDPGFYFGRWGSPISPRREQLLKHVDDLAGQVRSAGGVVVFVKSLYGRGLCSPQIPRGDDHSDGSSDERSPCCAVGTLGGELHPDAAALVRQEPEETSGNHHHHHGDLILTKSWYSAFMGTTLHAQFQRMGIHHVVVCGVTTNHSVAATVRAASSMGYNVLLSSEGTAQIDPKLQIVTEKVLEPFCTAILKSTMQISDVIAPSPIKPCHPKTNASSPDTESKSGKNPKKNSLVFDGDDQLSGIGTGDSLYFPDLLPKGKAYDVLENLLPKPGKGNSSGTHGSEVDWKPLRFGDQGYHGCSGGSLPRLVTCQASVSKDGHVPVYRSADPEQEQRKNAHEDEAERTARWTQSVSQVKDIVEGRAGHSFNWSKLLCYRDGKGEQFLQSDTCLDIEEDSFVAIVSLGQERDFELLPKEEGAISILAPQRISLRHNSLLLLGPHTSRMFLQFVRDYDNGNGKLVLAPSQTTRVTIAFRASATMYVPDGIYPAFYGQGSGYEHFSQLQKARAYLTRREKRTGTALAAGAASLMALATGGTAMTSEASKRLSEDSDDCEKMSSLKACAMAAVTATSSFLWGESRRDHLHQQEQDRRLAQVHRECRRRSVTTSQARLMILPAWSSAVVGQASSDSEAKTSSDGVAYAAVVGQTSNVSETATSSDGGVYAAFVGQTSNDSETETSSDGGAYAAFVGQTSNDSETATSSDGVVYV